MINYYKGNLCKAITDSFPEIGMHISLFFISFSHILKSNDPKKTSTYAHAIVNTAPCLFTCFIQKVIGMMPPTEENFSMSLHHKRDLIPW